MLPEQVDVGDRTERASGCQNNYGLCQQGRSFNRKNEGLGVSQPFVIVP